VFNGKTGDGWTEEHKVTGSRGEKWADSEPKPETELDLDDFGNAGKVGKEKAKSPEDGNAKGLKKKLTEVVFKFAKELHESPGKNPQIGEEYGPPNGY